MKTIGTWHLDYSDLDESDAEVIYSESFEEGAMGSAIMNRLLKAAGYQVVRVQNRLEYFGLSKTLKMRSSENQLKKIGLY